MRLILDVPVLLAQSTLRFAAWRQVIADCVAGRTGASAAALLPQTITYASLGLAIAADEPWLHTEGSDLTALLGAVMLGLATPCVDGPLLRDGVD